jgi:preprotein translocase subunit SecE
MKTAEEIYKEEIKESKKLFWIDFKTLVIYLIVVIGVIGFLTWLVS